MARDQGWALNEGEKKMIQLLFPAASVARPGGIVPKQLPDRDHSELKVTVDLAMHRIEIIVEGGGDVALARADKLDAAHNHLTHCEAQLDLLRQLAPDIEKHGIARELVRIAVKVHLGFDRVEV